jgi:hypothetical protein
MPMSQAVTNFLPEARTVNAIEGDSDRFSTSDQQNQSISTKFCIRPKKCTRDIHSQSSARFKNERNYISSPPRKFMTFKETTLPSVDEIKLSQQLS